ncbi:MAG: PIN domain-containing protein [Deltaproteobacteria bacterium]|nr:PIN domain-containing protein [Deltaproteobacteria bacterium]
MRFAIDTNVLVSATFEDAPGHGEARAFLDAVLASDVPWCLAWVTIYEYLRVVTHARVFARPLTWARAWSQVSALLAHPRLELLVETDRHRQCIEDTVALAGGATGNFVHDCHLASLMSEHDVRRIVTSDSHFRRFPGMESALPAAARGDWMPA